MPNERGARDKRSVREKVYDQLVIEYLTSINRLAIPSGLPPTSDPKIKEFVDRNKKPKPKIYAKLMGLRALDVYLNLRGGFSNAQREIVKTILSLHDDPSYPDENITVSALRWSPYAAMAYDALANDQTVTSPQGDDIIRFQREPIGIPTKMGHVAQKSIEAVAMSGAVFAFLSGAFPYGNWVTEKYTPPDIDMLALDSAAGGILGFLTALRVEGTLTRRAVSGAVAGGLAAVGTDFFQRNVLGIDPKTFEQTYDKNLLPATIARVLSGLAGIGFVTNAIVQGRKEQQAVNELKPYADSLEDLANLFADVDRAVLAKRILPQTGHEDNPFNIIRRMGRSPLFNDADFLPTLKRIGDIRSLPPDKLPHSLTESSLMMFGASVWRGEFVKQANPTSLLAQAPTHSSIIQGISEAGETNNEVSRLVLQKALHVESKNPAYAAEYLQSLFPAVQTHLATANITPNGVEARLKQGATGQLLGGTGENYFISHQYKTHLLSQTQKTQSGEQPDDIAQFTAKSLQLAGTISGVTDSSSGNLLGMDYATRLGLGARAITAMATYPALLDSIPQATEKLGDSMISILTIADLIAMEELFFPNLTEDYQSTDVHSVSRNAIDSVVNKILLHIVKPSLFDNPDNLQLAVGTIRTLEKTVRGTSHEHTLYTLLTSLIPAIIGDNVENSMGNTSQHLEISLENAQEDPITFLTLREVVAYKQRKAYASMRPNSLLSSDRKSAIDSFSRAHRSLTHTTDALLSPFSLDQLIYVASTSMDEWESRIPDTTPRRESTDNDAKRNDVEFRMAKILGSHCRRLFRQLKERYYAMEQREMFGLVTADGRGMKKLSEQITAFGARINSYSAFLKENE